MLAHCVTSPLPIGPSPIAQIIRAQHIASIRWGPVTIALNPNAEKMRQEMFGAAPRRASHPPEPINAKRRAHRGLEVRVLRPSVSPCGHFHRV